MGLVGTNAKASAVTATSCTEGTITDSSGYISCKTPTGIPEYAGRTMTAGATIAAWAVIVNNGSTADSVIEAPTTAASIIGCAQNSTSATSTTAVTVANAGIAKCNAGTVTAGSLVKIDASGRFADATDAEKTFGRAVTSTSSGTAYILLGASGSQGFIDHKVTIWDSFPDNTTATAAVISPTISVGSSAIATMLDISPPVTMGSGLPGLTAVQIAPAIGFATGSTVPVITDIRIAGTLTTSAASDEFLADKAIASSRIFDATVDSREPLSSAALITHGNTYRYSAASGSASGGTVYVTDDNSTYSTPTSGGQWTTGVVYGERHRLVLDETSGAVLVVPDRRGFVFEEATQKGGSTGTGAVTAQTAITIAALAMAGSNVGIESAVPAGSTNYFLKATSDAQTRLGGKTRIGSTSADASAELHVTQPTIGNEVFRLESVATNDDPVYKVYHSRATAAASGTTNIDFPLATAASVDKPCPDDSVCVVEARTVCHCTSGSSCTADAGGASVNVIVAKNDGGTMTVQGSADIVAALQAGSSSITSNTLTINGNNARMAVAVPANFNHTCHVTWIVQSVGT